MQSRKSIFSYIIFFLRCNKNFLPSTKQSRKLLFLHHHFVRSNKIFFFIFYTGVWTKNTNQFTWILSALSALLLIRLQDHETVIDLSQNLNTLLFPSGWINRKNKMLLKCVCILCLKLLIPNIILWEVLILSMIEIWT